MPPSRWGLYPGTFDPVHLGHLGVAKDALSSLNLSGVVFLPAGEPPNKAGRSVAPGSWRASILEVAVADESGLFVSRADVERPGLSRLVDTLNLLRQGALAPIPADADVFVLSGWDTVADLPTWQEPARILELAEWAAHRRSGHGEPDDAQLTAWFGPLAGRIHRLPGVSSSHGSTEVRARLAAGLPVEHLVGPVVAAALDANPRPSVA